MATAFWNMSSPDSELLSTVVRMITPMRREFGHTLDVEKFFADRPYALEVIQTARGSGDQRLREYVAYVEGKWLGPRNSVAPSAAAALKEIPPASAGSSAPAVPNATAAESDDAAAMRAKVMAKYKSGLR